MSISDDREFMERLDQAFGTITPGPAPIEHAMRQGAALRLRRRTTAAMCAAFVAMAAVAIPAVHSQMKAEQSAARRHDQVTVNPPGPHAPPGLIASGRVGGKPWHVIVGKPGAMGKGQQCIETAPAGGMGCGSPLVEPPSKTIPVSLGGSAGPGMQFQFGAVLSTVTYVMVRLADGSTLILEPVTAYGVRYVAFAAPAHENIMAVTAYSQTGEIATAIPWNSSDGLATTSTWLQPGQQGLARHSGAIGSGKVNGHAWSAALHVGPWGYCVTLSGAENGALCSAALGLRGTSEWSVDGTGLRIWQAAPQVAHVVIFLAGGRTIRVPAVQVGTQKYFAFGLSKGQRAIRYITYDASRHEVGWGPTPS